MSLYEINSVSIFRHKYIVEADNVQEARSLIQENAPEELTQRFVSENIVDSKEITKADFNHILKQVAEDEEEEDNSALGEKIIYKQ
tara:strand:+ start:744 stop:1001 length:258 start_codon:yes stop_codon:yes gene_type:complete